MIYDTAQDPSTSRIVFLTAFVLLYALVHFVRWYRARPKVDKDDLPAAPSRAPVAPPSDAVREVAPPAPQAPQAPAYSCFVPEMAPRAPEQPAVDEPPSPPKKFSELFTAEEIARMMEMGKVAFGAGWLVEAHFWFTLARAHGTHGLGARIVKLEDDWQMLGCPDETDHVYPGYSPEHAAIAQAYMLLRCGIAQPDNAAFILSSMAGGSRTARTLAVYERLVPPDDDAMATPPTAPEQAARA